MREDSNVENPHSHIGRVWSTVGIVALTVICLLIIEATFSVVLLMLAGTLVAVFFRGLSGLIQRKTKWNENFCVYFSILSTLVLIAGFFWLIGAQIQTQIAELSEKLPKMIDNLEGQIEGSKIGDQAIDQASSEDTTNRLQAFAETFFSSTFGAFGDIYVVLFIGIFLTVSPKIYIDGIVQLVPEKGQNKAVEIFQDLGEQLRNWIKGKLFSMLVVFIMTAIGLAILKIPLWLVLALLAGTLSFIPNFGPLLALIPAVLVASMQGTQTAIFVVALYILIQFIESNFITTLIQQKMVNMPPALVISAQMLLGALTGSWGLLLSTPLTVIIIVLINQLYIRKKEKIPKQAF